MFDAWSYAEQRCQELVAEREGVTMYVPVPALPTQLTKAKTEVSFRAENPWNGNQLGTFHLDDYVVTLRGANSVPQRAYEPGGCHRALRSEEDGISRFLPESLIELWLTKQALTESLPGLLKQMEPQLKKSDYKPMLRSMKIKVLVIVEMALCAALLTIAIVAALLAQAPAWVAAAVVLGTASVCWGFLYLLYFGKLFRRKRQMRWLLDRIQADHAFPATQPNQPDLPATPTVELPGTSEHAGTFVSSLDLADADPFVLLSKLRAAFPELTWEGGEGVFGRIHLAGESTEGPSTIGVHLLCKEPPGPFTLTIRLGPTGATALPKAYALKARLVKALDLAAAPRVGDSAALASSMAKGKRIGIITPRGDAPATTPRVKKADLTSGPPALSPPQPKAELWTSSGLHPGDQVEQYVLTRQMDRDEQISNIETWLATDGAMGDLILKIYWGLVGDEYGGRTDLGPYISSLLPELDKLVAMPRKSGVAPWVRYHYREQDRRLVMCRRAYPDRMLDRFPISGAPYPGPALLEVLGQIAEGIDHLTDLAPLLGPPLTFSISTDNLLMEGALACIADFAPVLGTIRGWMFETYGPVLMLRRASSFCLPELYYFLRTGMKTRKDAVGAKCVDGLIDGAERDLVARALSSNPPEYSCKEFVKQLALASHPSKSGLDGTFSRQPPIELRRPPPLPPWNAPHDYTYDTNLSVPGGIEPRMESILQRDIPEFRWQDEAENWGKIRLVGNSLEPFEGVTVSIARNEPPGPFNLRITVQGAIRPAADAFHKAITQRIELALYAAAEGPPKVQPSFTKSEKPFHPPFFSRRSILCVSREPGMALRIKDAIPELIWLDEAPDWEQLRIIATRDHPRTVVSILRGDPTGPFLDLWVHTAATSTTIAHDMRSKEVLNSLLDRIYAATQAYRPTVTFNNELSIHEKRLPWLPSILEKGIPELSWRNDPKKSDPADTLRIVGTSPDPDQSLFVCITPAQPLSSPYTRLRIEIVLRRCFEHHAEPFHRALLQRLNHSFRPNSYHPLESMAPEALQTGIVEFFVSLISTPFVRPFFSLRAEVPVAEEFENDGASAIVPRLRDNIPELVWTSAAEDKGKIRIAAQSDRQADSPAAVLPTANRIQYTRLSLFRPGPSTPFELWIHITADSSDEANRALHSLEHRLCRVLGSAGDPDLNRNDQGPGPPL